MSHGRISVIGSTVKTTAGLSSLLYRGCYMPPSSIGRTPEFNYGNSQTSTLATIFLDYLNEMRKVAGRDELQYSRTLTKEVKVGPYYLDGICSDYSIEINGNF